METTQFNVLGPLEVVVSAEPATVGGRKQRELLCLLILHRNRAVSASRLAAELWGDHASRGAEVTLRSHVSHLRRRLDELGSSQALSTGPAGYRLVLAPEQVDADRFERHVGLGQEAYGLGHPQRAVTHMTDALRLWRGPPLPELDRAGAGAGAAEVARLEEVRLGALEVRAAAELAAGRHREIIAEVEVLTAAYPFRERFVAQLMIALYRSGRQAEALEAYGRLRERLAEELGLDPGPEVQALAQRVLRQDPVLLGDAEITPPGPSPSRPWPRSLPDAVLIAEARTDLVGRSAETTRLDTVWRQVVSGDGRMVLLSGAAGIGKTRLLAELTRSDEAARPHPVLVGRCEHGAPPYHTVGAALSASAEIDAILTDAPPAVLGELRPLLAESPAIPHDRQPTTSAGGELGLYSAVLFLLRRLAQSGPVMLIIDNAEHIDRASALVLRYLAERLPAHVLVVVSYRDPPGGRHPPLLELLGDAAGRALTEHLSLGPLNESEVTDLVRGVLPSAAPRVASQIWRHTGGNPFFVREMARSLASRADGSDPRHLQVPIGVRDVLRHRLQSLSKTAQALLPAAAVLGAEVDFELLTQVTGLPEDQVAAALEEAVTAGLLVESGRAWVGSYAFPQQVMRESLAAEISGLRLRSFHLRAARALMVLPRPGPGKSAAVASHLRAAGPAADADEAAEWSGRAARDAAGLYAWPEAVEYADAAVSLLEGADPPTRQAEAEVFSALLRLKASRELPAAVSLLNKALRRYLAAADDAAAGLVHSRLGGALCLHHSVMDIPRALEHFAAAERLLPAAGDVFNLHRGRSQAAMYGLRTTLLLESADRAAAIAAVAERRDLAVVAGWGRAWGAVNQGRLSDAGAIWERIWATAHELADPYLGWIAVNAAALVANAYLWDPTTARSWCRRGLGQPQFTAFVHPHGAVVDQLALALAAGGELAAAHETADPLPPDAVARRLLRFLDGHWEEAEASWAAAAAADEASGDVHDAALNLRWLAMARRRLRHEVASVSAPLERVVALSADRRQVPTELAARAELAELLAVERTAEAVDHLARCEEIVSGAEDWRGLLGQVELARAAVGAATGNDARAEVALARAVDVFETFRLPWQAAAAGQTWADWLDSRGRRAQAEDQRRRAAAIYAAMGAGDRWRREPAAP